MNVQLGQGASWKSTRLNTILNQLSLIVLFAGVLTISNSYKNALIIVLFELAFAGYCTFLKNSFSDKSPVRKNNRIVIGLIATWFVCVTLSLLLSPLELATEPSAIARYLQALVHVYFFYKVYDLLKRTPVEPDKLLLAVPTSSIVVVVGMVILLGWFRFTGQVADLDWFHFPPFNSHIRHSGYQVAAGLAVLLGYLAVDNKTLSESWLKLVVLLILTTFMFWMGGRGSIVSVAFGALIICAILILKKMPWIRFLFILVVAMVAGAVLSEIFAVFSWNGLFNTFERTADAEGINQLATGRIDFWKLSFAAFLNSPLLGLGPQSYFFLPGRTFGVQPHSAIFQFLLEWGILGSVIFVGLLIAGFVRGLICHVIRVQEGIDPTRLAAGSVILVLSFHALFDGTYYHPQPSMYLALAFAFWITHPRDIN